MTNKRSAPAYRVHIDFKGQVWYMSPGQMPISSASSIVDFFTRLPIGKTDTVQVIAERSNVPLILHMYERKLEGRLASLQVCAPSFGPSSDKKSKRADIILMDSSQWNGWPASVGGWHEFTEDDYPSYYLAKYYGTGVAPEVISNMLKMHPAWGALSFIPHLNEDNCGRLIASILDPRWFIDQEEPEKNSKLESFLGLVPKVQTSVSSSEPEPEDADSKMNKRCKLVMGAWKMGRPTSKAEYAQPNAFLWRLHATEGAGPKADLRVSQTFVSFLKSVWLDEIYRNRGGVSKDGLFVPSYFFKREDEIKAFNEHMLQHCKRIN